MSACLALTSTKVLSSVSLHHVAGLLFDGFPVYSFQVVKGGVHQLSI